MKLLNKETNRAVRLFYHQERFTTRIYNNDEERYYRINGVEISKDQIIIESGSENQVEISTEQMNKFNSLFVKYKEITSEKLKNSGQATQMQHQIILDKEKVSKTKLFSSPYPTSPQEKLIIEEKIKDQLDAGVLVPIDLLQPYQKFAAGVTLALRNSKYRFCADYRKPCDQHKTTITTHLGLFMYKSMSFGITSASATFQRFMNYIFKDHLRKFIIIYIDDFIIFINSVEEHYKHLEIVFDKLYQFNLKFNTTKCEILKSQLYFLGYTISIKGRTYQPEKFENFKKLPAPINTKEVLKFLGSVGYYR
ncbi:hypothetical protein ACTFIR_003932 [Dictyostelium discoideum]